MYNNAFNQIISSAFHMFVITPKSYNFLLDSFVLSHQKKWKMHLFL